MDPQTRFWLQKLLDEVDGRPNFYGSLTFYFQAGQVVRVEDSSSHKNPFTASAMKGTT